MLSTTECEAKAAAVPNSIVSPSRDLSPEAQRHTLPHLPAGISAPLFLKAAVDTLSAGGAAVLLPAVRCVLLFGLCGIVQQLTKELCHPTFTPISQVGRLHSPCQQSLYQPMSATATVQL